MVFRFSKIFMAIFLVLSFFSLASCSDKEKKAQESHEKALDFMYAGNNKSAVYLFKKSLKYDDKNPDVWYSYGSILMENKSYNDAISALEKTAELSENTKMYENSEDLRLDALVCVGEAYLWQGDLEKANDKFQSVFNTVTESKNVVLNIVATYVRCGHSDLATNFLKTNITTQGVKEFLEENKLFFELMK